MALEMRSQCKTCGEALPPDEAAFVCSYECTVCEPCAESGNRPCPNCGGELVRRPRRAGMREHLTNRRGGIVAMTRVRWALLLFLLACEEPPQQPATSDPATPVPGEQTSLLAADAGTPKLLPVDQADASFRAFRDSTLVALARQDATYLYGILAPDIRISFGADNGIAGFKRMWAMEDPDSHVWSELARILEMGGAFASDSLFMAPYVYAVWPDSLDAFEFVAVTSPRAPVFRAPEAGADTLGTASYSLLELEEWRGPPETATQPDTSWAGVVLPDGRSGWLRAEDFHSPVDWRAIFARRDGRWFMTAFVAGD